MTRLPRLLACLCAGALLAGCNGEDVRAARRRSAELQRSFAEKTALLKGYEGVRQQVEALHAELSAAPEQPLLPDLPARPTQEMWDQAATAQFPPIPPQWDPLESTCRHASLSIL